MVVPLPALEEEGELDDVGVVEVLLEEEVELPAVVVVVEELVVELVDEPVAAEPQTGVTAPSVVVTNTVCWGEDPAG